MSTGTSPQYEAPAWRPPPPPDPFGPIVSGFEVEQAVAGCVRRWMRNYLRAMERQRGVEEGWLPFYRFQVASSFEADRLREDQLPALAIVARGTVSAAGRRTSAAPQHLASARGYIARWAVACHSVCVAPVRGQARQYAQWYTAALRTLLLQHRTLDPSELPIVALNWVSERYGTRSPSEERTNGEGVVEVEIEIAGVSSDGGPSPVFAPSGPDEPLPELPLAQVHEIVVQHEEE